MIPEGYRLLTKDDDGKIFGVDLELQIYIDTNAEPISDVFIGNRTNFIHEDDGIIHLDYCSLSSRTIYYYSWYISSDTIITMNENLVVEIYYDDSWNNWFYVKDIQKETNTNPYFIKIKNKNGIILKTANKLCVENITLVLDESLFENNGNEEQGGYTLTLNNFDMVYYALSDSDDFTQITSETLVLNDVTTIKFKTQYYGSSSDGAPLYVSKNGSRILTVFSDIKTLTIEEDTTLTAEWGPFSGGGAN